MLIDKEHENYFWPMSNQIIILIHFLRSVGKNKIHIVENPKKALGEPLYNKTELFMFFWHNLNFCYNDDRML